MLDTTLTQVKIDVKNDNKIKLANEHLLYCTKQTTQRGANIPLNEHVRGMQLQKLEFQLANFDLITRI